MNVPEEIPLIVACSGPSAERARAVIDGTIRIPNCRTAFVPLGAGEMLFRSFADPELNVAELSLSNYVTRTVAGNCPYVVLPVYISRAFPHSALYVRTDRGISAPHDLRGRRIGITEYQHTINVWVRGMLEDEYSVKPSELQWVSVINRAHANEPPIQPPGVSIERLSTDKTLSDILESGEIDVAISAHAPQCFTRRAANVGRLFRDPATAGDDYFSRTGIFPILHVMGVRRELLERDANLAANLFRAFSRAKDLALASDATARTRYSYGVGAGDRKALDVFLDYHIKQGLSERRLSLPELFAPVPVTIYES